MTTKAIAQVLLICVLILFSTGAGMAADGEIKLVPGYKDIIFEDSSWGAPYTGLEKLKANYIPEDYKLDISPPAANDSQQTADELALLFQYAKDPRTPEIVEKIKHEKANGLCELKFGLEKSVITPETKEKVDQLEAESLQEMSHFLFKLQRQYKRARPSQLALGLVSAIPATASASYPSDYAAIEQLNARIFSYIDPQNQEGYLQKAAELGKRSEIVGINYPSDTVAGQAVADQVFNELLEYPKYRAKLDEAKRIFDARQADQKQARR